MKMIVTTDKAVFEFKVNRFFNLSEIRKSASTTFGRFSMLKGHKILSRHFIINARCVE